MRHKCEKQCQQLTHKSKFSDGQQLIQNASVRLLKKHHAESCPFPNKTIYFRLSIYDINKLMSAGGFFGKSLDSGSKTRKKHRGPVDFQIPIH